ncbi:MAG: AAA family ATPase [Solobacterium sp.]|nr:AAA family ATPase [Solobacterium sp.]
MNRDKKHEEKERLMEEVLNKDRSYKMDPKDAVELSFKTKENVEDIADTMKRSDEALDSLKAILEKQQKDLENLGFLNAENQTDMDKLQQELEAEYNIHKEAETVALKEVDAQVFDEIKKEVQTRVVIEEETLQDLVTAFRRPFVMGENKGQAKNVIIVTGPRGSNRHASIAAIARSMYERQIFVSDEVYTIDMSLYQSNSQEQIFLQDLYSVLNGKGSVIVFENFEVGFPSYLRMLDDLACDGKVTLNKRYVLNKGVLVENQTGLVKDAIDSFYAEGKYFIFLTTKGTSSAQDAFGADFLYHVLDVVKFNKLDEERTKKVLDLELEKLKEKAKQNLKLNVQYDDAIRDWLMQHFDKTSGTDSISELMNDFYISISQKVLDQDVPENADCVLKVEEDTPVAMIGAGSVKLSRTKTSQEEIEAINAELNDVVGLDMVKDYIKSLQSHIHMQAIRREQGMKTSDVSKHMIFTGNPGTGKTTIARLISRYMKAIGALTRGQLVEVTRADLVAQYVGQTAPLTMNVIKSALGGVLFIDEAYSLYRGKDDAFGLECIDTIVKAMEDHRDDLIIILAGYRKEMAVFLESNSGLKSRFPNIIDFPDYTGLELRKIAEIQAKSKGYVIADDVKDKLEEYFNKVQSINAAEAGNGRLSRNVVEDAILAQSERIVANKDEPMDVLKLEDFDFTIKVKPPGE